MKHSIIPIIKTDVNGIVTYRNPAAIRCIPSPRKNADINLYINKNITPPEPINDDIRIAFLHNNRSLFTKAFVLRLEDQRGYIWVFSPELALMDAEDIRKANNIIATKQLINIKELEDDIPSSTKLREFNRHQRYCEELICKMKPLTEKAKGSHLDLKYMLDALRDITKRVACAMNYRIEFDQGICLTPYSLNSPSPEFPSAYAQLLSLCLRLSENKASSITTTIINNELQLDISFDKSTDIPRKVSEEGLEQLARLFKEERSNILMIEGLLKSKGYRSFYQNNAKSITISLNAPLTKRKTDTLSQSIPPIMLQRIFMEDSRRFTLLLEALLKC